MAAFSKNSALDIGTLNINYMHEMKKRKKKKISIHSESVILVWVQIEEI